MTHTPTEMVEQLVPRPHLFRDREDAKSTHRPVTQHGLDVARGASGTSFSRRRQDGFGMLRGSLEASPWGDPRCL